MDKQWESIYEKVKKNRPSQEKLLEYSFLPIDKVRIEKNTTQDVMVVAEDKWSETYGMCLVVVQSGKVYAAELPEYKLYSYCAGSFSQFVAMAEKYWEIVECEVDDNSFVNCEEQERILREYILEIDETALEGEMHFWSTIIEEAGYGV